MRCWWRSRRLPAAMTSPSLSSSLLPSACIVGLLQLQSESRQSKALANRFPGRLLHRLDRQPPDHPRPPLGFIRKPCPHQLNLISAPPRPRTHHSLVSAAAPELLPVASLKPPPLPGLHLAARHPLRHGSPACPRAHACCRQARQEAAQVS
jgi:hypothetical protein